MTIMDDYGVAKETFCALRNVCPQLVLQFVPGLGGAVVVGEIQTKII